MLGFEEVRKDGFTVRVGFVNVGHGVWSIGIILLFIKIQSLVGMICRFKYIFLKVGLVDI